MKRDKALGHDPLAWIKATKEAESKQAGETSKPEEREGHGLEAAHPLIKKSVDVEGREVEETKGRPSTEKPQTVQKTVEARQERIHVTPEHGYTTTKEGFVESRVKTPYKTTGTIGSTIARQQKETSIIFIIAYAVLLLILTFFVYFNLSERLDNMGLRISNIEKALNVRFKEKPILR